MPDVDKDISKYFSTIRCIITQDILLETKLPESNSFNLVLKDVFSYLYWKINMFYYGKF